MSQNRNKMLVIGTNAGQADLIRYMVSLGWSVEACAHRSGGPGDTLADALHLVDAVDVAAVSSLAERIKADFIFSISSDVAMTSAVAVSEKLNLPHFYGNDIVDLLNQKPRLRAFLNSRDLGVVDYIRASSLADVKDWSAFPCMVKPADSQGQRGVQKISSKSELNDAVERAIESSSSSKTAIVETFLGGVEVSCNVLTTERGVIFDVLSERLVHGGDLVGVPAGHLVPCVNVSEREQKEALDLVHRVVEALGYPQGCLYFQMKITPDGPKIIEIAPRLDGCHMWRLIKHATEGDFLASTVETLIGQGEKVEPCPPVPEQRKFELIFQQIAPNQTFNPVEHPIPEDALYHEYRYQPGETVQAINGKLEVVGYYIREMVGSEAEKHIGSPT